MIFNFQIVQVYVPFDVQKLTDETKLSFKLGTFSLAQWFITVNQIECKEKAAVKWDERQGKFHKEWVVRNEFLLLTFKHLLRLSKRKLSSLFNRFYSSVQL